MKKRILIVDDEFGLADVVAEILAESGFEVAIAINGALGLQSVTEKPPDLIILDQMMPVLDGISMLKVLRGDSKTASIPVILMTALPEALPTTKPALWQKVLNKPFTPEELFNDVHQLLKES